MYGSFVVLEYSSFKFLFAYLVIRYFRRCRDSRTAKSKTTSRDDGIKQFSIYTTPSYIIIFPHNNMIVGCCPNTLLHAAGYPCAITCKELHEVILRREVMSLSERKLAQIVGCPY